MKIISLSGKAGAGKDTAADIIEGILGKSQVNRCAFANKLKEVCKEVFDLSDAQVYGHLKEEPLDQPVLFTRALQKVVLSSFGLHGHYPSYSHLKEFKTPREIMQYVGTEFLRSFDSEVHLRNLPLSPTKWNIVTDARFKNEIDYLHARSASSHYTYLALFIDRDDVADVPSHSSEGLTRESTHATVIDNNGSLDDLESAITEVLNEWLR